MKKVLLTLMSLLTLVCGTSAKTVETTLWNDTYTDGVEISSETVATFKAGDVLRVYVTVPDAGANFKIVYKGQSNDWAETTIPSLDTQWPWVNGGETYKDITITAADLTAIGSNNIYLYQGESSTITKVTLITTVADEGTAQTLWEGAYTDDGVEISSTAIADFEAGDKLRVYVTVPEGGANFKIVYKGESNSWTETSIPSLDTQWPWVNGGETYKDITITAADLTAIGSNNIYIYKGENSTISKVALVKGAGIEPITEGDYTVTVNEPENGTVVTTHLKADAGAEVTLVVTPATNYTLVKLRIEKVTSDPNGDSPALARRRSNIVVAGDIAYATTDNKNFTFTMPASDVEVTAVFTNKPVAEPTFAYDATNNKVTLTPGAADDTFAANAKVYYTTDGSDPTTSGTRQEATAATDITVTADMTVVKAVGADADGNLSQVVEQAVSYQRMITVSKEWTAFCSPETFAVPTGLKAYTIESVTLPDGTEEGTVTLKEQTVIARNVPMIIQNTVVTDGITSFPIANADAVEIDAADQCAEFKGVAEATTLTADHVYYVLKDGVFIRAKAGTVNAYNCYLQFDAAASARCFTLAISYSGTTAIEAVATIPAASVTGTVTFYRLNGTQVTAPTQKGIYICQGKKIVVK